MAPFLRRAGPAARGSSAAKTRALSEEAATASGLSRLAFAPPRAGRSGAFATPNGG